VYRSSARYAVLVAAALTTGALTDGALTDGALTTGDRPGGVLAPSQVVDDVEAAAKTVDLSLSHATHGPADLLDS
jgi:hypothetical protein